MAKVRVKINNAELQKILHSGPVMGELAEHGQRIATNAGDGYTSEPGTSGKSRGRVFVNASTYEAIRDNAKNATLLRSLGGR